jgi:hypothetical protein
MGVPSLYEIFKRVKRRRIEKPGDIARILNINIGTELLIQIYSDPEVQAQLRKTLEPFNRDGIKEFQTRRNGIIVDLIRKSDLRAADEAVVKDLTRDEEVTLDIEKAAWRRDLAWHFSDAKISFDAKISHDKFWKPTELGEHLQSEIG